MTIDTGNILLIGSILLFISILAGKAGYRFGVPMLLLFLGVGMFFGSDGLGIQFNNSAAAQFIGMMALSIILFSGGMDSGFFAGTLQDTLGTPVCTASYASKPCGTDCAGNLCLRSGSTAAANSGRRRGFSGQSTVVGGKSPCPALF